MVSLNADTGPFTEPSDEGLVHAAARILARHHHPEWRPNDDHDIDVWGHGYNTGWRQGYADGGGR